MNELQSQVSVRSTAEMARPTGPTQGELMQAIADMPPPSLEFADVRVSFLSPIDLSQVLLPAASERDVVQAKKFATTLLAPAESGKWTVLLGVELIVDEPGTALLSAMSQFSTSSQGMAVTMHVILPPREVPGVHDPVTITSPGGWVPLPFSGSLKAVDTWLFPVEPGPEIFWLMAAPGSSGAWPVQVDFCTLSAVYISSTVVKDKLVV